MCIISVKKKGVDMPKEKTIRTMFKNNPDGAGFMILRENEDKILLSKGYHKVEDFLKDVRKLKVKQSDQFVMHFRIETSGGISDKMCHPFVVSENKEELTQVLVTTEKMCMAHNGIIYALNGVEKKFSDTAIFARDFLAEKAIYDNVFKSIAVQELIEEYIDKSRMVLMHPEYDGLVLLGEWEKGDDGCLYSNTTYKKEKYTYHSIDYSGRSMYGNGFNYGSNFSALDDGESTASVGNQYGSHVWNYEMCDCCTQFEWVKYHSLTTSVLCQGCIEDLNVRMTGENEEEE